MAISKIGKQAVSSFGNISLSFVSSSAVTSEFPVGECFIITAMADDTAETVQSIIIDAKEMREIIAFALKFAPRNVETPIGPSPFPGMPDFGKRYKPDPIVFHEVLARQRWAADLIEQLSESHDGRNSWLMNFGHSLEANKLRKERGFIWDERTLKAIPLTNK